MTASSHKRPGERLNATVSQRIEISPGLAILRVVPDGWVFNDFKPGQFTVLGLPGTAPRCDVCDPDDEERHPDKLIKRAYSIASSSLASEFFEFYLVLVRSGALTPRLFALSPGDRLWVSPKIRGLFTLDDVPEDKNVVLISTGTGLAPYMSMLRTRLACDSERRFAVLHGARHSWDLGYRSELMTLDRLCGNFTYAATVSRPDEEGGLWRGPVGYVQDLWTSRWLEERAGFTPSPEHTRVFLCGNPSMIDDMVAVLERDGFQEHKKSRPGQIHTERYW